MYAGRRLSFARTGQTTEGLSPRSEPDSGKPTVRDRREACGNVVIMADGLRPVGKPTDTPPYPTMLRAPHFYPDHFTESTAETPNREPPKASICTGSRSCRWSGGTRSGSPTTPKLEGRSGEAIAQSQPSRAPRKATHKRRR